MMTPSSWPSLSVKRNGVGERRSCAAAAAAAAELGSIGEMDDKSVSPTKRKRLRAVCFYRSFFCPDRDDEDRIFTFGPTKISVHDSYTQLSIGIKVVKYPIFPYFLFRCPGMGCTHL